ncbi:putative GTP-binding protein 6 [Lucilia sericata]|uniref:putative GTP-binding protein 6 n=1 Tax=Lucilia sericata TaxID=13632 RepID=UPI0018A7FDA0|nr:putative GTP-binding protein 6 [Lucilia sericata]
MFFNLIAKRTSSALFVRCLSLNSLSLPTTLKHFPQQHQQQKRFKYTQNKGVKGLRNRKHQYETKEKQENNEEMELHDEFQQSLNLEDSEYDLVANGAMNVTRKSTQPQNVLVIQPYVKWGPKRATITTPDDQLEEAKALIHSINNWSVALAIKVPLESLERKALFGKGKMEEIRNLVQELRQAKSHNQQPLTCIFVSKGSLSFAQKALLEATFHLPVMDRYSVVIQILRLHATSAEARLQVAMAEIPYIWSQAKEANTSKSTKLGYSLTDTQREILKTREKKLKMELERIRNHRKLLRNKRKQHNYPIVAVVGYTNAGKTSIIKALTQEQTIQPKDQLFATLDVTAHAGRLPCNLEVIYMDTVGFMSDLPTGLIECFVATLEDAMLADVILHVQDVSHACYEAQKQHVETTLKSLTQNMSWETEDKVDLPPIISVGNKIDLLNSKDVNSFTGLKVSAKKQQGLSELMVEIENHILATTNRRKLTIRVPNGGIEMSWLYKNAAVVHIKADSVDSQNLLMDIVIKESVLQQFKKQFCQK